MAKPSTRLRKGRRSARSVGTFFEHVAKAVTRGKFLNLPHQPDLAIGRISCGLEVKAGGSRNGPYRIPLQQFTDQSANTGEWPCDFTSLVYCLFSYSSRTSRGVSILTSCKSEADICMRLATFTHSLHIIDHRIIAAIMKIDGARTGRLPSDPERESIQVRRRLLQLMTDMKADVVFTTLKLSPDEWRIRVRQVYVTVHVDLFTQPVMDLRVVEVLPNEAFVNLDMASRVPTRPVPSQRTMRIPGLAQGATHIVATARAS